MKAVLLAMSVALNAIPSAHAEESPRVLQLRSKAAIAVAAPHRSAPYVQPLGEPEREPLFTQRDARHDDSRSSCEKESALCYDQTTGRIVYKPARQFMPSLPGLNPENISVKRDRIVFKYTF